MTDAAISTIQSVANTLEVLAYTTAGIDANTSRLLAVQAGLLRQALDHARNASKGGV
jgi:hypothetical protein